MKEEVILTNLLQNDDYMRKVLPFLREDYFQNEYRIVFKHIKDFIAEYNKPPTESELLIELESAKNLSQHDFDAAVALIKQISIRQKQVPSIDWLIQQTEQFCKDKALYNAIIEAASMIESKSNNLGQIPELLSNALSVSFDTHVGHDFKDMIEQRYKLLRQNLYRIPFDIEVLNEITNGGLPRKTLSVISASTGAGKTLFLCHCAAHNLLANRNVLYITLEMAEERISERIDANILNINIQNLPVLSLQEYTKRLHKALEQCTGRLIIKEYPTAGASVLQFRALLNELKLKKQFMPDIIFIDYINICASSRYKPGTVNSYQYVKAISEELRALAIEYNLPIVSATQFNREGIDNSDVSMKEISESHGLAMTADLLLAMIRTEELDHQNLVLFKQLKNRFADLATKVRFIVGIDRAKMKLFDADTDIQITRQNMKRQHDHSNNNDDTSDIDDIKNSIQNLKKPDLQKSRFKGIKVY